MNDLDELTTEAGGTSDVDYELRPTVELVEAMNAEDATVAEAVGAAGAEIAAAIDAVVAPMRERRAAITDPWLV